MLRRWFETIALCDKLSQIVQRNVEFEPDPMDYGGFGDVAKKLRNKDGIRTGK